MLADTLIHTPFSRQHLSWLALRPPVDSEEVSSSCRPALPASAAANSRAAVDSGPSRGNSDPRQALTHIHQQREDSNTQCNLLLLIATTPILQQKY